MPPFQNLDPGAPLSAIVPIFAVTLMALEFMASRLLGLQTHSARETGATFAVWAGQVAVRSAESAILAIPFAFAFRHRWLDIDMTRAISWIALLPLTDLIYYWHHRISHRVRWLWASHSVHHSTTRLNLTSAVRLGWTGHIAGGFLFYLPIVLLGFDPRAVAAMLGLNLLYQFFIHTELVRRLGPLEWIFNTPAHHRAHHASNPSCIDKNFGGILIVFDRAFGTFVAAPADEPLRYGLAGGTPTLNPFHIALGQWRAMFADFFRARGARSKFSALFGPPG